MARYKIESLNRITSGSERNFIDVDITLDTTNMDLNEYVHLLQLEEKQASDVLDQDILLEHKAGTYKITEFLAKEFNIPDTEIDQISGTVNLSSLSNAISTKTNKEQILLNEQQTHYTEDSSKLDVGTYIQLILSCCTKEYRDSLLKVIGKIKNNGRIYEMEYGQSNQNINTLSCGGLTLDPIYDTYDVHFKSRNRIVNDNVLSFDNKTPMKTEDLYLPQSAQPIGMCQSDNQTIILTNPTTDAAQILSCSLNGTDKYSTFTMDINNGKMKTYLFPSKDALRKKLSCDDSVQSYSELIKYYETEQAVGVYGNRTTDNFSKPAVSLGGIQYNYVATIPMNNVVSEYNNGNVYCDIYNTKNVYNSTYSMEMSSFGTLLNCRNYTDIYTCGGKVYLKYYDNVNYRGPDGSETPDLDALSGIHMDIDENSGYTYQKVESFNPVSIQGRKDHKSLFFSVNVADIDLDQGGDSDNVRRLKDAIRHDITTAVKEISKNVTPANTQLFDVKFGYMI